MVCGSDAAPFASPADFMRVAATCLLIALAAPAATAQPTAQTARSAVADSLMQRWVEIWNARDADAMRDLFAADVVMMDDALGTTGEGRDTLMPGYVSAMAETHSLQVRPFYSYDEGGHAYHVGRWIIYGPESWRTGTYTFIFDREPDGEWELQSTYYTHDPVARLEEFRREPE